MSATASLLERARKGKLIIGMVHVRPLPGSPRHAGETTDAITGAAAEDARAILAAGFDGYIVENFGDAPFFKGSVPPHVLTILTRILLELPREGALVGINVLRNDARGALAVAAASGADMVRVNVHTGAMVTDQGLIEGDAASTTRYRQLIAPRAAILADVGVKHAAPLGAAFDLCQAARETAYRSLADGLIVTGKATGSPVSFEDLRQVREAVPDRILLAGSGVTRETIRDALQAADGVIVGTSIKQGGRVDQPVDRDRARALVLEARG